MKQIAGPWLRGQRGAITVMTAGFVMLAVLCLTLVVDTGRLYLEKRELQRVADMAALEAVAREGACNISPSTAQAFADDGAERNGFTSGEGGRVLLAECGGLTTVNGARQLVPDADDNTAIRVTVTHAVPASLLAGGIFGQEVTLKAVAIASKGVPLAALTLATTLINVSDTQAPILNAVFGGLLGGSVNLDVVGWNGLVGTDIELFNYLDLIATDLDLGVGNYDEVLDANLTVGQILTTAITALQQGGGTGNVNAAIAGLTALGLGVGPTTVKLGELLQVATGTPSAGAVTDVNLFQLVQGAVMLANGNSAATADFTIPVGVATVGLKLRVIEPPQLSAVGNPALINPLNPDVGPNRIYVHSAQVRALVSMELGGTLNIVNGVLNGALAIASPVTSFLNQALTLGLVQALGNFLGGLICPVFLVIPECPSRETGYMKVLPNARVDIALDLGGGHAYVTGYSCAGGEKSLDVTAHTSTADVRLGKLGNTTAEAATNVFTSGVLPAPQTIPLLDIGRQTVKPDQCLLALCWPLKYKKGATWVADRDTADLIVDAGIGLNTSSEFLGSEDSGMVYDTPLPSDLPEIGEPPAFQTAASGNDSVVDSLTDTLAGVELTYYRSASSGLVGTLLADLAGNLNLIKSQLQSLISAVLSPLLQPLVTFLLNNLGLDLGQSEVGANLSCSTQEGVVLVL